MGKILPINNIEHGISEFYGQKSLKRWSLIARIPGNFGPGWSQEIWGGFVFSGKFYSFAAISGCGAAW